MNRVESRDLSVYDEQCRLEHVLPELFLAPFKRVWDCLCLLRLRDAMNESEELIGLVVEELNVNDALPVNGLWRQRYELQLAESVDHDYLR